MAVSKKGIGKTITTKVLPAAGGGAGAAIFNQYIGGKLSEMLPESLKPLSGLAPGLVGLYLMDNKDPMMQMAGAGMIGKVAGDTVTAYLPIGDDVLADANEELDELFEEINDEYEEEDEEDEEDFVAM